MTERTQGGELAPHALVRVAALPHPDGAALAAPFRRAVESLAAKETELAAMIGPLADLLHDSAGTHDDEFHRRVVLPLRRDVHNGRMPRPALLSALGDLPSRIPRLGAWLAAMAARASLIEQINRTWPEALSAEREVLASVCASEPLRRAAVLSGRDLWQGLARAGSDDKRARKAEPTVLRYALRATSKTSPLSWYTSVGWGTWAPDAPDAAFGEPHAVTRVNHVLLTRLIAALTTGDHAHPHRLAPELHERRGVVRFRRDIPAPGAVRAYVGAEESVEIKSGGPVRFLIELVQASPKGVSPAELITALSLRLPDGEAARAEPYVARLLDIGLLVPVSPVDPQDPDACLALAHWLDDPALAAKLRSIHDRTKAFADAPTSSRPGLLVALEEEWRALGELVGTDLSGVPPLSEDVVLPKTVRLGRSHGYDGVQALARLTPLLMLFDRQLLIRRIARDRFATEFGRGGVARPADCSDLLRNALVEAFTNGGLHAARQQIAALTENGEITEMAVEAAADLVPTWMKTRPVSYSFFAQPMPGGLVVNHIYDGFGRFPGRFLDLLPPEARTAVRATLGEVFPRGFAEYRPVLGFNANLHPLLGTEELGEDPRWAGLAPDQLELCLVGDELRLRRRDTKALMDVLYLGYLMPMSLPDRAAALHADLACGWVDLSSLQSVVDVDGVRVSSRLRYRDVVLARRSWEFGTVRPADDVAVWAAQLRARHGLPAQVFVGLSSSISSRADFEAQLGAAKPQYADLTNALHLRGLPKLLSRYDRVRLTEALPVPSGQVLEVIAETYRRAG